MRVSAHHSTQTYAERPAIVGLCDACGWLAALPETCWLLNADGVIQHLTRDERVTPSSPVPSRGLLARTCIPPRDREAWDAAIVRVLQGEPGVELLLTEADRCTAIRFGLVRDADVGEVIVATLRDISDAYAQANRSAQAELRFDILTEVTGSVVYERALDSARAIVSASMQQVFGYDPALAFSDGLAWWLSRVHVDDQHIVQQRFAAHRPGHTVRWAVEYRVQRSDGTWAIVQDQGRTLDATEESPARAVGILTDVSRLRAMQAQLQHSQRLEMVGQLAAGVAHDFNNVLSAIGGFTSILLSESPPDDARRHDLAQIEALVARASGLTQNLLGLTRRREHGRTRLVNVADELTRLVPTLRILLGSAIELEIAADPLDVTTAIDPGLLDQVILNLAANARDATPDGGRVRIEVRAGGAPELPRVLVSVRDTGSGMPAQVLQQIFQPFFTTKGERRGTGLGLWLVREIVESAGGHIEVESAALEGTTVLIDLPAVHEPPSGDPEASVTVTDADSQGLTCLLIEDEEPVRYVTRRILERNGFRVLEAEAGREGLRLLMDHRDDIDVIVTDLHMPGLAGLPLVERLRRDAPEVGCLVVSGLAERLNGMPRDPDHFCVLAKPCDTGELLALARHLGQATRSRRDSRG